MDLDISLAAFFAPKPKNPNHKIEPKLAPIANVHRISPNWLASVPSNIKVSRYTCGLRKVKPKVAATTVRLLASGPPALGNNSAGRVARRRENIAKPIK